MMLILISVHSDCFRELPQTGAPTGGEEVHVAA
jgi:hypothetical protein